MAHNKLYRNFIILQEDERGYSHSNDKALSGYAKVEAKGDKCKVSFYAQNLRQEDNYSMVLICCKRDLKQLIDLGPLAINGVGKGDTSKDYYVNNIAGLGMSYEKISGAAICRVKDNETEFIMHGFMNGEDSSDNWRRFKIIKVDSKKCSNKLDEEPKKKDISSLDIADKAIISKSNNVETKIVKTSKLESGLVERKKDEVKPKAKENIELLVPTNSDDSKVEDKQQNRIPEIKESVTETINISEEDRNKCKEVKKHDKYDKCDKHDDCDKHDKYDKCDKHDDCDKHDKYDKCDKHDDCDKHDKYDKCDKHDDCDKYDKYDKHDNCDKHDKCEKAESIEDAINKLGNKLDNYNGVMDIKIKNMHQDIIIYGFIKDKKDCDCKWKKFKAETKCRNESQEFYNIEPSSRRIEENFKLDNLNTENRLDRLDILDFDEYENKIQQAGPKAPTGQKGETGEMGPTGPMGQKGETGEMGPTGLMGQKGETGEMGLTGSMGQKGETGEMGPTGPMGQKGETGEMGPTGPMGQKGETGEMGPIGPMGQKGETGKTGEMGPIGPMGQKGEKGEMGPMNTQCKCETETSDTNMCKITISTMEEPEAVKKIEKCNLGNMQQSTSNQNFNITGEVGQYFEKLAKDFELYNGSLADINYCKLYKINVNSIEDLSDESNYNQYTLAYYPMLNYYPYISKEGYFLLGYKCNGNGEMKYIVYAIPGSKDKNDQPYGGRTGFVTWTSDNTNGRGYWLMFYDFKNSSIVIPTK